MVGNAHPTYSMDEPAPELRTDRLTGRTVLIAENRAHRPNDFAGEVASATGRVTHDATLPTCPFCAGNEFRTPPPVYEKLDNGGRWQVRVVPNIFPGVMIDAPPDLAAADVSPGGSQQSSPAFGAHEVVIESPNHIDRTSALSPQELREVLEAYAERLRHWQRDGRFRYGLVFKNQGPRAGASIAHLHSQLVALPFIPATVEAEQQRAADAFSQDRLCPYCRLIANEQTTDDRIILCRDGFIAFCPFASWQPGEVWIMPISHEPSFELVPTSELDRLTNILHAVIARLESLVPGAAYNMLLRTAPWTGRGDEWSHWRIELLPRVNAFAGLEVATGIHINPLAPERAASRLRLQ